MTGPRLKKALGINRAKKRYHNKNNSGGNFAIDLLVGKEWFEINGYHDTQGCITEAGVGRIYDPKAKIISTHNCVDITWDDFITKTKRWIT